MLLTLQLIMNTCAIFRGYKRHIAPQALQEPTVFHKLHRLANRAVAPAELCYNVAANALEGEHERTGPRCRITKQWFQGNTWVLM